MVRRSFLLGNDGKTVGPVFCNFFDWSLAMDVQEAIRLESQTVGNVALGVVVWLRFRHWGVCKISFKNRKRRNAVLPKYPEKCYTGKSHEFVDIAGAIIILHLAFHIFLIFQMYEFPLTQPKHNLRYTSQIAIQLILSSFFNWIFPQEQIKSVPVLSSSLYGHRPPLEIPSRRHVRVATVQRDFYRHSGTNIPLF